MSLNSIITSSDGITFLERHEGVVLKAYRDPVGVWTIGAGLTKASGVITPKAGMVITSEQASTLLAKALAHNYEPSVRVAMPGANQHEFDGGVSFHWNTGAIEKASWVKLWRLRDWYGVRAKIKLWNKGGGRVLPGLVRRRDEEYRLIKDGVYGIAASRPAGPLPAYLARVVVSLSESEIEAIRGSFHKLGYPPGDFSEGVLVAQVEAFQRDHDLTVDGIIGRATLSTLQRMIDAPKKAVLPVGVTVGAVGSGALLDPTALPIDPSTFGASGGLLWLLWTAWQYRDAIAAVFDQKHPEIAKWLRSV